MKSNLQSYVVALNQLTETLEQAGEKVDDNFQELKKQVQLGTVDSLDSTHLQEIKQSFQATTDAYQQSLDNLKKAGAPAKLMGKNQLLKRHMGEYVQACQAMVDAIDVKAKTVDGEAFFASETAQETTMDSVNKALMQIFNMLS